MFLLLLYFIFLMFLTYDINANQIIFHVLNKNIQYIEYINTQNNLIKDCDYEYEKCEEYEENKNEIGFENESQGIDEVEDAKEIGEIEESSESEESDKSEESYESEESNNLIIDNYYKKKKKYTNIFIKFESKKKFLDVFIQIYYLLNENYNIINVVNLEDNIYSFSILNNFVITTFELFINKINFEDILKIVDNTRLEKLNIDDNNTYCLQWKYIDGDIIKYYEYYKYVKNNFDLSLEKVKELKHNLDLIQYKKKDDILIKLNIDDITQNLSLLLNIIDNGKIVDYSAIYNTFRLYKNNKSIPNMKYQLLFFLGILNKNSTYLYIFEKTKEQLFIIFYLLEIKWNIYWLSYDNYCSKNIMKEYKNDANKFINSVIKKNTIKCVKKFYNLVKLW